MGETVWTHCPTSQYPLINYLSRFCFNFTLAVTGIFALASGGSSNFVTLASLIAVLGVGVGGNLPVDSAVFLGKAVTLLLSFFCVVHVQEIEFVPATHQYLLTILSIWWAWGQLLTSLVSL